MCRKSIVLVVGLSLLVAVAGCTRDTSDLMFAPGNTDPLVFGDDFGSSVIFQAFAGSKLDAVQLTTGDVQSGSTALLVTVPPVAGSQGADYAGGAFTTDRVRDFSVYNALAFWAKSDVPITLDVAGFGNDNTGGSLYTAERRNIPLTTTWTRFFIPIPLAARLSTEGGLFFFAEGDETGVGSKIWFDDIRFVNNPSIGNPQPTMPAQNRSTVVGAAASITGTETSFDVGSGTVVVSHMPGYFTFFSTDDSVVRPTATGIRVVGPGAADVTARLGDVDVVGTISFSVIDAPSTPAPTPTVPAEDVVSIFSDVYADVAVDKFVADWSAPYPTLFDVAIAGNLTKVYTNLGFAGIEIRVHPGSTPTVDASQMTHFHMDVFAPEGFQFRVKLVDFGPDDVPNNPPTESEVTLASTTTPPFVAGQWSSLEIPMAFFASLTTKGNIGQIIISGGPQVVFIDNIYFHK